MITWQEVAINSCSQVRLGMTTGTIPSALDLEEGLALLDATIDLPQRGSGGAERMRLGRPAARWQRPGLDAEANQRGRGSSVVRGCAA